MCFKLFFLVRYSQCNQKVTKRFAVSTTFEYIVQLGSSLVPFFREDPLTYWIQSIMFQWNIPNIPKMSFVDLIFPHWCLLLQHNRPQVPINTNIKKRQEERFFTWPKTPDQSETGGGDSGIYLKISNFRGRGVYKRRPQPYIPNQYAVGGGGGGSYYNIQSPYCAASKSGIYTP